jgi:hypothetical protein
MGVDREPPIGSQCAHRLILPGTNLEQGHAIGFEQVADGRNNGAMSVKAVRTTVEGEARIVSPDFDGK